MTIIALKMRDILGHSGTFARGGEGALLRVMTGRFLSFRIIQIVQNPRFWSGIGGAAEGIDHA